MSLGESQDAKFLVRTDSGDVLVSVNGNASGLDDDLILLEKAPENAAEELGMVTPLRAFGAKMVDLIEMAGTEALGGSASLREMMVKEKATQELNRIERFARSMD